MALDIPQRRLHNQHLALSSFDTPLAAVHWLGAVQAQDYGSAKWALGLRIAGSVDDDIERAFNEGAILRTHVMRPTWHFVAPADIRWLLELTGPRVHAINAPYYRRLELDEEALAVGHEVIADRLEGGQFATRDELRSAFGDAGINMDDGLRLGLMVMHAELDGLICSGPRRGKQFTYALMDERVPAAPDLSRDTALATLTARFFTSHGPATMKDMAWWSGLKVTDVRQGLEMLGSQLVSEIVGDHKYWYSPDTPEVTRGTEAAYLLPNYDEFGIAYRNHDAVFDVSKLNNLVFDHLVVVNGQLVGTWRRTLKRGTVLVEVDTFDPLSATDQAAVAVAAKRFGDFLGLETVLL